MFGIEFSSNFSPHLPLAPYNIKLKSYYYVDADVMLSLRFWGFKVRRMLRRYSVVRVLQHGNVKLKNRKCAGKSTLESFQGTV